VVLDFHSGVGLFWQFLRYYNADFNRENIQMNFKKIIINAIALVTLLAFSSCQNMTIDPADEDTKTPDTDTSQTNESNEAEDFPAEIMGGGDLLPDGVLVNTDNGVGLIYLDANGQILSEIQTPGIGFADPENVAIAGTVIPGQPLPPIIYRGWEPEGALLINTNGQTSTLRLTNSFLSLNGTPGQSALAFSEVMISPDNYPHSFLYAGNIANLDSVGSFYDLIDEPTYMALMTIGVEAVSGEPQGVWYTKTGWGIGGADLIFPITRGLYFFDLTNGDNLQYIDADRSFQGISPDLSHAGTVDFNMAGDRAMTVVNLTNNRKTAFTLDPASDRGAGFSVFSPNNQFAAWLEASGSMISEPSNFHPLVRIGNIQNGSIVKDLVDAAAVQAINGNRATFMRPVGWLTNEILLMEVRGQDWGDVSLLSYDVISDGLSLFSSGNFVGFGYQ